MVVVCSPGWGSYTYIYIPERRDQCETLCSLKPGVDDLPGVRMERLVLKQRTKEGVSEVELSAECKAGFWTLDCCLCA